MFGYYTVMDSITISIGRGNTLIPALESARYICDSKGDSQKNRPLSSPTNKK